MKLAISFLIALLIGVGCRLLDIPLPAPPAFFGAVLICFITGGYLLVDWLLSRGSK